jgi:bifunctional oligoribonuclease and PAP phosphatase NrnA
MGLKDGVMNYKFAQEFELIKDELDRAKKILLVAHTRPDGDTVGSVFSLKEYLERFPGKEVVATCTDPFPEHLRNIFDSDFLDPHKIDISKFDLLIGCDAVERGFEKIIKKKEAGQKIIILDHHTTVRLKNVQPDILIADENYSSVCEILYDYFDFHRIDFGKKIASYLLVGILNDTGIFQHANTTPKTMEIAANLMRKGASLPKIIQHNFKNKRLETLKLWGRALERAEINEKSGAIMSYITKKDLEELSADAEDVASVAEILNTVSGTKFSLVLSEREDNKIKGSLRSEEYKNVDVSEIARMLRGGGHRLASGFEIRGQLVKDGEKWRIE